jgi:hypothetical protein
MILAYALWGGSEKIGKFDFTDDVVKVFVVMDW